MKKTITFLTLFLAISFATTSCSKKDEIQETLVVKRTIADKDYEKTFTVDANNIKTDTKGFEISLKWSSAEDRRVDLDLYVDAQAKGGDLNTGFDEIFSKKSGSYGETISITNSNNDTFGKTLVNVYSSGEDTINFTLTVKQLSDNKVVASKSGTIQTTLESVTNQYLTNSKHSGTKSHGFMMLGDFVKVGDKFYFDY